MKIFYIMMFIFYIDDIKNLLIVNLLSYIILVFFLLEFSFGNVEFLISDGKRYFENPESWIMDHGSWIKDHGSRIKDLGPCSGMNDHPGRDTDVRSRPSESTIKHLSFYIGCLRIGSWIKHLGPCLA